MPALQYPSETVDPHVELTRELVATQIEVWLLEARQADVRRRLQQCRTQRAGLGRQYRRLVQVASPSQS